MFDANSYCESGSESKPFHDIQRSHTLEACYVGSKFFQLEELEDRDTCTTEIFLSADGRVMLTETDGPPPTSTTGSWERVGNKDFKMTLLRSFGGGSSSTDMGEFAFTVERTFTGEFSVVGESVHISGSVHSSVSASKCNQ